MTTRKGTIRKVTVNRNTIAVVAQISGPKADVRLFADGEEVHPLVFNPIDRLHHSMIWRKEGETISKLEGMDTTAIKEGSWTTLTTPKTKPTRANTLVVSPNGSSNGDFTHANPGDLLTAINRAVAQGDTEIVLKDGVYKQTTPGTDGYMAAFRGAGESSFASISIVAECPRKAIISNLLDDSGFMTTSVDEAAGLYTVDCVPRPIHQLHAVVNGQVERLQERFSSGDGDWTEETLKASPIGGWFIAPDTDQLLVKLPAGSNPAGKLKISDPAREKAWLFSGGTDLWIEGIVFEYWLTTPNASGVQVGSSLVFQNCQQVVVRNCESRYTIDYAFHFAECTDYLVENCDFIDGQTYTTYITMRTGLARFSGTVRSYHSALGTIRHNRWQQCFVANQFTSSRSFELFTLCDPATQQIEFHHNFVRQARNHPLHIVGNGGGHAIWANTFDTCGQAMPGVEQGSPISPVYWINNLATDAGFFGVFLADGTDRVIKGNRFGGLQSPRIGQYFFYYNTLRTEWFPPEAGAADTIQRINAWQAGSKDHSASRYFNNIFTAIFEKIGVSRRDARVIWFHEGADTDGTLGLHLVNLSQMQWDCNQYFWNKTNSNGEPTDVDAFFISGNMLMDSTGAENTFAALQMWVKQTMKKGWEPHGAFQDPQFDTDSHPTNAILAMTIPGVTGNAVLELPGDRSGATI